jgi:hypothetical protein
MESYDFYDLEEELAFLDGMSEDVACRRYNCNSKEEARYIITEWWEWSLTPPLYNEEFIERIVFT